MAGLSLSRAWVETRERIARDGNLLVTVALALLVLPQLVVGLLAPPTAPAADRDVFTRVVELAATLIALIGQIALVRLANHPGTRVGDAIQHGTRRFGKALLALLLFVIGVIVLAFPVVLIAAAVTGVGVSVTNLDPATSGPLLLILLLLVLVVLLVSVRFMLIVPVASEEQVGAVGTLRRSWALSRGHFWRLFAFLLLVVVAALFLLGAAGLIGGILGEALGGSEPMSVGALLAAAIAALAQAAFTIGTTVMVARIYAQLAGAGEAEASVPTTGT